MSPAALAIWLQKAESLRSDFKSTDAPDFPTHRPPEGDTPEFHKWQEDCQRTYAGRARAERLMTAAAHLLAEGSEIAQAAGTRPETIVHDLRYRWLEAIRDVFKTAPWGVNDVHIEPSVALLDVLLVAAKATVTTPSQDTQAKPST